MISIRIWEQSRRLLCRLQDHIRDELVAAREKSSRHFADIAAVTAADVIYQVDKISEEAILSWFEEHWPTAWPVELVMEGIEEGDPVTFPHGTSVARTLFKCILDPIDGTRNMMYDKRSAWILTGLAPQRGARTDLRDLMVAAMTELPTSKQRRSDQVSAVRGRGIVAEAVDLHTRPPHKRSKLLLQPSQAKDCRHAFASFAKFFPEGKAFTAQIEEELWGTLYPADSRGTPLIFDDQYITTGGQLYEILAGHDRLVADIRPRVFRRLGLKSALVCHPYDICTALLLPEAGAVVETADGRPLSARLDTTSPVEWVGYSNPALARAIRPALRKILKHLGC